MDILQYIFDLRKDSEYEIVLQNIVRRTTFLTCFYHGFLWTGYPMVPLIAPPPPFFLALIFVRVHNILQLSMYHCMTYIQ
jgi:hypothetical protein